MKYGIQNYKRPYAHTVVRSMIFKICLSLKLSSGMTSFVTRAYLVTSVCFRNIVSTVLTHRIAVDNEIVFKKVLQPSTVITVIPLILFISGKNISVILFRGLERPLFC